MHLDLNEYQKQILASLRAKIPGDPPEPWRRSHCVPLGGLLCAGWTKKNQLLLVSPDGHTLFDPSTGEYSLKNLTQEPYKNMSPDHLVFTIPETEEQVAIFGIFNGNGNCVMGQWNLSVVYPAWPNALVTISSLQSGTGQYGEGMFPIKLDILEYCDLSCAFSNDGQYFVVIGSAGAELFTRMDDESAA